MPLPAQLLLQRLHLPQAANAAAMARGRLAQQQVMLASQLKGTQQQHS
jgi:hypothetical protein